VESLPLDLEATLRISKASSASTKPTITQEERTQALTNAKQIVALYEDSQVDLLVRSLKAAGLPSVESCQALNSSPDSRLSVRIAEVHSGVSPLGLWSSHLIVETRLTTQTGGQHLWNGRFYTGSRAALSSTPDRGNVEALAKEIASDVSQGPWFKP
jgi:hypothetical protein